MANDLVIEKRCSDGISGYLGRALRRGYEAVSPGKSDIPIAREQDETQFELSCIGRPWILKPLYRVADSIGITSPEKRIDSMVQDVEHSVEVLENRIKLRSDELIAIEKRYDAQKRTVISKRADAKSALEKGKSFLRNGNGVNDKDELLDLANAYSEYKQTEKLIGEYKQTLRWLESERDRQKDKAVAIKKLFVDGKQEKSQQ